MFKRNTVALFALCAILGVGLANAHVSGDIPLGFWKNDESFLLNPVKVEEDGNRKVLKFGNEEEHGQKVATWDVKNQWKPARDVDFTGGYPSFFEGVLKKLSYAEITIESDDEAPVANFYHYSTGEGFYDRTYYKYQFKATNVTKFNYHIELFE